MPDYCTFPMHGDFDTAPMQAARTGGGSCGSRRPEPKDEGCCKQSMLAALQLLGDPALSPTVDFRAFAFVTDFFIVGATLVRTSTTDTPYDNLSDCLTGSFQRFTPGTCDLIDVSGAAYPTRPTCHATLENVASVALSKLDAVAFQLQPGTTAEEYARFRAALARRLQPMGGNEPCQPTHCSCQCDSVEGILSTLSGGGFSRTATLTAGPLALAGMSIVGTLGSVAVLTNETNFRFYLVCADKIALLG